MKIEKGRSIAEQICEHICLRITSGEYISGQRIPSVRELALEAGVNPNTVQGALNSLEGRQILYSVRGSGWYVCDDTSEAESTLQQMQKSKTREYFNVMHTLGLDNEGIKNYVKEWQENE